MRGVPAEDSVGKRYGRLVVTAITGMVRVNPSPSRPYGGAQAEAEYECDCGVIKTALLHNIRAGKIQSCGCLRDYQVGEVVGRFTVIKSTVKGTDRIGVRCADCGTEKEMSVHNLVKQSTSKCLCIPQYKSLHKSGYWQVTINRKYVGWYKTEQEADKAIAKYFRENK